MTCTGSHIVDQADIDTGTYANTATASGRDGHGGTVSAISAEVIVTVAKPAPPTDVALQIADLASTAYPLGVGLGIFGLLILLPFWRRRWQEGRTTD